VIENPFLNLQLFSLSFRKDLVDWEELYILLNINLMSAQNQVARMEGHTHTQMRVSGWVWKPKKGRWWSYGCLKHGIVPNNGRWFLH
jgi:hypothetical protein